jgi:energy-coupling factor transport system permease protein
MISFRFKDKDTPIHRLNPFCKLVWVASILVLALIFDHPLYILLLFLSTLSLVAVAKIWREWASAMKLVLYLGIFIVVINTLVVSQGAHVLLEAPFEIPALGPLNITLEAIFFGLMMALRLLTIISAFTILNLTIHPDDMMLAMIKMKLPYKSVLATSLSTRFVPTLIDDIERLTDVQRTRGLEMDKGRLLQKVRKRATILIPLLSNSLDRTVQVAEAMESRAFGQGNDRTFYKEIRFSQFDIITLAFGILPLAFGIFVGISGYGSYQYYPTLEKIGADALDWLLMAILLLLLAAMVPMAFLKRRVDLD